MTFLNMFNPNCCNNPRHQFSHREYMRPTFQIFNTMIATEVFAGISRLCNSFYSTPMFMGGFGYTGFDIFSPGYRQGYNNIWGNPYYSDTYSFGQFNFDSSYSNFYLNNTYSPQYMNNYIQLPQQRNYYNFVMPTTGVSQSPIYAQPVINPTLNLPTAPTSKPPTAPTSKPSGRMVNYRALTREQAIAAARADANLEELVTSKSKKGFTVTVSQESFINDIPFAKKGTMKVLLEAADRIGRDLTITSALGCKSSPHAGTSTGNSHYNPSNPKIDFGGSLTHQQAKELEKLLRGTGLFNFVNIERHGKTAHLDAQIKLSSYDAIA